MKKHTQFICLALFAALAFAACQKTASDEAQPAEPSIEIVTTTTTNNPNNSTDCQPKTELGKLDLEADSKKWFDGYAGLASLVFENTAGERIELKMTQPLSTKYRPVTVKWSYCTDSNGNQIYTFEYYQTEDVSIIAKSDDGTFYINDCTYLYNLGGATTAAPAVLVDMAGGEVRWNGSYLGRKDLVLNDRSETIPATNQYPKISELLLGKLQHNGRTYEGVHKIEMNPGNFCYFNQSNGIIAIEADGQVWSRLMGL